MFIDKKISGSETESNVFIESFRICETPETLNDFRTTSNEDPKPAPKRKGKLPAKQVLKRHRKSSVDVE